MLKLEKQKESKHKIHLSYIKKKKLKRGPYIRILYIEIMHGVFPNEKA